MDSCICPPCFETWDLDIRTVQKLPLNSTFVLHHLVIQLRKTKTEKALRTNAAISVETRKTGATEKSTGRVKRRQCFA